MNFSYYGHSCFCIEIDGCRLLFDPFISGNELTKNKVDVDAIEADYILVSHGHQDHILDTVAIANRTGAKVICAWEVMEWLHQQGLNNIHPMNTGGERTFENFTVKCTVAQHSSSMPDGSYGGNPMGFIISTAKGSLHYAGDTALTLDMQLIPLWCRNLKAVILPIGDNFTMGYQDAVKAADFMQCDNVIAVHFDTFDYIKVDHEIVRNTFAQSGKSIYFPLIGETIDVIANFNN